MGKPSDGGPAFPILVPSLRCKDAHDFSAGMSLRDYLAAHAPDSLTSGEISVGEVCRLIGIDEKAYDWSTHWPKAMALIRYRYADEMIAARKKNSPSAPVGASLAESPVATGANLAERGEKQKRPLDPLS